MVRGNHQWASARRTRLRLATRVQRPVAWPLHLRRRRRPVLAWPTSWSGGCSSSAVDAVPPDITQHYFGLYAQDTWRLSPSMTLNYGLRWEPWFPQQHQNLAVYTFSRRAVQGRPASKMFPQAPPGFTYPGDEGFPKARRA